MRKLSGKTINSLALCVALAAPLVYLFGTLFMTLAGAHGNVLVGENAQPLTETYISNEYFQKGKEETNTFNVPKKNNYKAIMYYENPNSFTLNFIFDSTGKSGDLYFAYYNENNELVNKQTHPYNNKTFASVTGYSKYSIGYYSSNPQSEGSYIQPDLKIVTQTNPIEIEKGNNSLFQSFFTTDNFLAESGREVLNGTPLYGFEPIGELVRYTDTNMLHLANLSYGPLVIGYTYYCAHVIIVDLIFYIGSFIPRLIKKTINKLEGGLD